MWKSNFLLFLVLSLILPSFTFVPVLQAKEADDSFLMQDFEEPVPEFVREAPTANVDTQGTAVTAASSVPAETFSVKKRTYLSVSYGPVAFAGGSELDNVLKDENKYFKDTYNWNKTPFTTPITQGLTGGIEVKKGWSNNVMLGLAVHNVVGISPENTIKVAPNELVADAKFEITTTFVNAYLYAPLSQGLEYYIGVGIGVGQGIIGYSEVLNNSEFESQIVDKASGAQIFTGLDWKVAEKLIIETKLFYRAMEFRNVSLTGGGLTLGLVLPF